MVGDTGGRTPQWGGGVYGAGNVARLLVSLAAPLARVGVVVEPQRLNGEPGAIVRDRDGRVLSTLVPETLDGRIQTIRSVVNPEKLGHLGPVADAWVINREANDIDPDAQD
jgi:RNA polymerase sigma-70 factor (ECF subfamily)